MKAIKLQVNTVKKSEMIDLTKQIRKLVKEHKVKDGYVVIFVPHTTAGVTINENADPDVQSDLIGGLSKTFPVLKEYKHFEGNSDAHIKSSLIGFSQTVLIEDYDLLLGVWQGVYLCEFDGPRSRKVYIKIYSD